MPRLPSARSSAPRSAPKSNSAPTVISPLIPELHSRYKIFSILFHRQSIYLGRQVSGAIAIINIYHRNSVGTGI